LDYVRYSRQPCFIDRHGRTVAALIDIDSYHELNVPHSYQKWIQEAVDQIVTSYKPQKIVLFGSALSGDLREGSDIDLLIIKETSARRLERSQEVLRLIDPENPTEPHVYTPDELEARVRAEDPFILNILKTGRVLYEA
jgi:predicted nucleotidyltransferase